MLYNRAKFLIFVKLNVLNIQLNFVSLIYQKGNNKPLNLITMKPTLLQLEQKTIEAKNICYDYACKLHELYELEKFCESLHWTAWEVGYAVDKYTCDDFAKSVISDYLKTVNVDYSNMFNKITFKTFRIIRDNLVCNTVRTASTYLESFYKGRYAMCIRLFNDFY